MDEICDQLLAGARFAKYQNGRVCIGDIQTKFDRSADGRSLSDKLALPLVKLALEPHDLGRKLIAFERRADLICDALDQCDVMIFESAFFAPHKSQKPKGFPGHVNRRDKSRLSAKLCIEKQTNRKRQLGIGQTQRFSIAKQLA